MYHFKPHCGMSSAPQPTPPQFEYINLSDIVESIAAAATFVEPLIAAQFSELAKSNCPKNSVTTTGDKFEVKVDVTNFKKEEITLRVVDNSLLVEAKHEEKEDKHGFISRQFTRRFVLPEGVVLEKMICKMISDNTILISAPRNVSKPPADDKSIPINIIDTKSEENKDSTN